ncbi:unnamed protein product [Orchesella dallaii]|uniref:Uncharacterized protein n=1 Tax=Orchesella dallaii TaxID=48710 RepID=A0ABP1QI09_9HEXA
MKLLNHTVPKVGVILNSSKTGSSHHRVTETFVIIVLLSVSHFQSSWVCSAASDNENESKRNKGAGAAEASDIKDNDVVIVDLENVVGYGEDCSSEGPFCDPIQNLACDLEEETCYCDVKNGYVHVGNLESDLTLFSFITDDGAGGGDKAKKVCMKSSELEERLDKLVNITKKMKNIGEILMKYQKYLPKKYQDMLKLKDEL